MPHTVTTAGWPSERPSSGLETGDAGSALDTAPHSPDPVGREGERGLVGRGCSNNSARCASSQASGQGWEAWSPLGLRVLPTPQGRGGHQGAGRVPEGWVRTGQGELGGSSGRNPPAAAQPTEGWAQTALTHGCEAQPAQPCTPYPPHTPVPAPQSPEGRRPVCIQSLFILCSSLMAVMDTSWFFSPNSSRWAKRGMYRQGSAEDKHLSVALGRHAPLLPSLGLPRPPICHTSCRGPPLPARSPPDEQPQEQLRTLQLVGRACVPCCVRWARLACAPLRLWQKHICLRAASWAFCRLPVRLSKFSRICFLHLRLWNSSLDLLPPCLDVCVHLLSERLSLAKGASLAGRDRSHPHVHRLHAHRHLPRTALGEKRQSGRSQLSNQPGELSGLPQVMRKPSGIL